MQYILSIDQSTSGTKAMLFDQDGKLFDRFDLPHKQIVNEQGWVEHDPDEILQNVVGAVRGLLAKSDVNPDSIAAAGISNQRETGLAWDKISGEPLYNAIVWQCGRGKDVCQRLAPHSTEIKAVSGLLLSPFFTAAKLAWLLENVDAVKNAAENNTLCMGNMDAWLLFKLTGAHKSDYSNASRTQLFDINNLTWSEKLCDLFGVPMNALPKVCDSDSMFGETDFQGALPAKIPVRAVMGDSHGALFGQGCLQAGMMKTTYGTGSSVMLNTGEKQYSSDGGAVTSLAWKFGGAVNYVLEGNINYAGAVTRWLVDDVKLIASSKDAGKLAELANPADTTYLVPAFTGLGAPYFKNDVKAALVGMSRTTGQAEIVRAAEECIAYQVVDIISVMQMAAVDLPITQVNADGGPAKDAFLMQFQADMLNIPVFASQLEELSGAGVAYMAGLAVGMYNEKQLFENVQRRLYTPTMSAEVRSRKLLGWKQAVAGVIAR